MAKRTKKTENTQEQDNREFFLALDQLERERGIKKEYMLEKITQALATAYKRDHEGVGDNIAVIADEERNIVRMVIRRDVVEVVDNPYTETLWRRPGAACPMSSWAMWSPARSAPRTSAASPPRPPARSSSRASGRPSATRCTTPFRPDRRAAHRRGQPGGPPHRRPVAPHQRRGERSPRPCRPPGSRSRGEVYHGGRPPQGLCGGGPPVHQGPQVLISRTHPGLVKRLFEMEVPEIFDGLVEVKSIAREAGSRTKMAVWSNDPNVDPIGACVGPGASG